MIVEALTDNRNRTASDVRHLFAKNDGNLGASGAVAWLFERKGVILVEAEAVDEDELTLAAADGGAEDVALDGSSFEVDDGARGARLGARGAREGGVPFESAELTMVPKTTVEVEDESVREEDRPADRRARGERRRPGRLRELRHPGAGARGGRLETSRRAAVSLAADS